MVHNRHFFSYCSTNSKDLESFTTKGEAMNATQMINRVVSKGYNREAAEALLQEVVANSFGQEALIKSLLHFNFITVRTAEKMVA